MSGATAGAKPRVCHRVAHPTGWHGAVRSREPWRTLEGLLCRSRAARGPRPARTTWPGIAPGEAAGKVRPAAAPPCWRPARRFRAHASPSARQHRPAAPCAGRGRSADRGRSGAHGVAPCRRRAATEQAVARPAQPLATSVRARANGCSEIYCSAYRPASPHPCRASASSPSSKTAAPCCSTLPCV